jgi:dihydrofolate reductase
MRSPEGEQPGLRAGQELAPYPCSINEYQIVVSPVVLGKGRTMFEGIEEKLTKTRTFGNGNVLLCYEPMT